MQSSRLAIQTAALSKEFKGLKAVDSLDLGVRAGELFGLVGPDGAGKTTTMRLLAGLLDISEGSAEVAGFDLKSQSEDIKPCIGYMAQEFNLYGELTVLENLRFFSELYDVPGDELQAQTERLLTFAGLVEFQRRRASQLSGGMKKKLALACTLIHRPKVLLLDEPTTGVDPISRREFWDILGELHLEGITILVSTPYMDEADRCSRVGLMHSGRLIVCDTPAAIRSGLPGKLLELKTSEWRRAKSVLERLPSIYEIQQYGESLHLLVAPEQKPKPAIERELSEAGIRYRDLRWAEIRMEEAFISLMRQQEVKLDQAQDS